ncbi:ATP-grasp domain-containing protein [Solidesulfovibrio sp.]|uniref:ATP-grasp domain-containing protein n=1 Tax=Solidesulfovibrio sp. TaxID=2910990 RepID=UPI00263A2249|nr:ATP-grasp domain-containing protein [Solidesulfovibrio sp.]
MQNIMIAGIGGASLGTEVRKCLSLAGDYVVQGCDISPQAYGHYDAGFSRTFLIPPDRYLPSVVAACLETDCRCIIPGGEKPMLLLAAGNDVLRANGITLLSNHPDVVSLCSDKGACFDFLGSRGIRIPRTAPAADAETVGAVGFPCIVKPATGSGGSAMVFFASKAEDALLYAKYIENSGSVPLVQEYLPETEGEFTVGVLSLPSGECVGSIGLRRSLSAKLSVQSRFRDGVISSGYTQGYIADFPAIRATAEAIAKAIGSRGPLNIQGRVQDGEFVPFEINPRFSASTYLRALAGFNEVDMLLRHVIHGERPRPAPPREGWYLRSLTETFVSPEQLKQ